MKEPNTRKVICLMVLSFIFLSIPAVQSIADDSTSISEVTSISTGSISSKNYHITTDTFSDLYSSVGKLKLTFDNEASLKVNVSSPPTGIDLSDLKICLVPSSKSNCKNLGAEYWNPLQSNSSVELGDFTSTGGTWQYVEYQLRYSPDKDDTPGNYSFTLEFELVPSQHISELDIVMKNYNKGQNEIRWRVKDGTGFKVIGAVVKVFKPDNYPGDPFVSGETGSSGDVWLGVPSGTSSIIVVASKDGCEKQEEFNNPS